MEQQEHRNEAQIEFSSYGTKTSLNESGFKMHHFISLIKI